jgi:hypothetical protein
MENSLAGTASEEENPLKHIGTLWGGDLQIYFNNYLGIYGRYNNYLKSSVSEKSQSLDGDTIEYGAFVEISLLRLSMGIFDEEWNLEQDDVNSTTNGTGILTSARLQF